MPSSARPLRQTVTLSAGVARRVRTLARAKKASASRVIAEVVESGLEAQEAERDRFLKLAGRLTSSRDPSEQEQLKEELARVAFGDLCRRYGGRTFHRLSGPSVRASS